MDLRFDLGSLFLMCNSKLFLKDLYFLLPILADLVIHPHCRRLVYANHHGLALKTSAGEMLYDIPGHGLQTVIPCYQMVLPGKLPLYLVFLLLIKLGLFQQPLHILVKVLIGQL
ncbi:hypothetical protein ES703_104728 [subsurface metagenome]